MTLRRPTNHHGKNTTDTPLGSGGVTKHCMTCNQWRTPSGFTKNKRTGMMRCAQCSTPKKETP